MDLSSLNGGLIVIARFLALLPKFVPHPREIGKCIGSMAGEALFPHGEDHIHSF